jgi:hypoxanthine phosphoribosyltransferase
MNNIKEIISEAAIKNRVIELGKILTEEYKNKDLVIIAIMNGSLIFSADIIREIKLPLIYDIFGVSSYINETSTGKLAIRTNLKNQIKNKHVLLIDDILDTGFTLKFIKEYMQEQQPLSIKTCVLLNKNIPNKISQPDYKAFDIENEFVVGYGLDFNEQYRNLPYIGVIS